jgi:hypothetical protein
MPDINGVLSQSEKQKIAGWLNNKKSFGIDCPLCYSKQWSIADHVVAVRGLASAVSMAGMNVTTSGPVICVDHPDAFWARIRNDAFPPVMSYFEPSKFTTSGANFIEAQRRRLTELIASAKSIAVVGIQVREQDSHIWSALGSTDARIYYCSGTRGAQAFKEWHLRVRSSKTDRDSISAGYWDTDFDAISDFIGMKA